MQERAMKTARILLSAALLIASLSAEAQLAQKVPVVALLLTGSEHCP